MQQYDDVLPGAADRVIAMAERQSEHRIKLETKVISWDVRRANGGLAAGFIIALAFLAAAVFLIVEGHRIEGTILGTIDLVSLVGTFVYGSIARRRELVGH